MAASVAEDMSLKVAVVREVELSYGGLEGSHWSPHQWKRSTCATERTSRPSLYA